MVSNPINQIHPVNQSVDSGVFRIKRPIITTNGVSTDVDPVVEDHFVELAQLLGKRVFGMRGDKPEELAEHVKALISPALTPKFSPPKDALSSGAMAKSAPAPSVVQWAPGTLAATLDAAHEKDG